jgi:prolyl oligopeptidase
MREDPDSNPPAARAEMVRDTYFGITIEDPYRWMEQESQEFRRWLEGQARHARTVLDALPCRASLRAQIRSLGGVVPQISALRLAGERVFYLWREADARVPVLVVRDATGAFGQQQGPGRILFDPDSARGEEQHAIDWYVPSPDGRYVACAVSPTGSENSALRVLDVDRGVVLDEPIPPRTAFAFVSWLDGSRSFVYHRFGNPPAGVPPQRRRLDSRSYLHRLGADPEQDVVVLARGLNPRIELTPLDRPFLVVPPKGDWMLALISHSALGRRTSEELSDCTVYVAPRDGLCDPASCPWNRVAGAEDGVTAFAAGPDTLYLVSYRDAPRFQVLAVSFADPDLSRARCVVPSGDRAIEAVQPAGDHLLVRDLDGGIGRLRRVALAGGQPEDIPMPDEGGIVEWTAHPDRPEVLLLISTWTDAPQVYRYDGHARTLVNTGLGPRSPVSFGDVEARMLRAPARDGTPIPVTVIHRKGLTPDGGNPTLLSGYGSYGVTNRPQFRPEMLAWYQLGGVYAVAGLRGGGEYGREWHEAGRGPNKERTITDFIDCAEYLIAHGYTRPERLAGHGRSAGGIPAGGALVRRPDQWAAMVMHVPLVNATRAEFSENGPINVPELGSLTTEEGLRGLLIIDPYLRVRDGTPYPAVLLTAGMNDPRVPPWQPAKLAARLQAASTSGRPIVLRVEPHGGHGFGSTRDQENALLADELAFLLHAFGLGEPG